MDDGSRPRWTPEQKERAQAEAQLIKKRPHCATLRDIRPQPAKR